MEKESMKKLLDDINSALKKLKNEGNREAYLKKQKFLKYIIILYTGLRENIMQNQHEALNLSFLEKFLNKENHSSFVRALFPNYVLFYDIRNSGATIAYWHAESCHFI